MLFLPTRVFDKNLKAFFSGKRRALNEGGTTSGKTFSIIAILLTIALYYPRSILISITSESIPHLKRGAIRDFKNILGSEYNDDNFNKTDFIYPIRKNAIEFFSSGESDVQRGGRRDILFVNEANNIKYDAYRNLDIRTNIFTFLDWNPTSEFWAHGNGLLTEPQNEYIHSTYRDMLPYIPSMPEPFKTNLKSTIANIESNKSKDPNWWNIYGEGKLGKVEGLVYPNFKIIERMPPVPNAMEIFGLDFGYTHDPTVLVRNLIIGQEIASEELIYRTGLDNHEIAQWMKKIGIRPNYDLIMADSAEPKSIAEIRSYGFNVHPTIKAADSVEHGHQKVNQYYQYWTSESTNCIKEQRNFMYIKDKAGKFTEKTTHAFSHGMDARRYAVEGLPILMNPSLAFHTGYGRS